MASESGGCKEEKREARQRLSRRSGVSGVPEVADGGVCAVE